MAAKSDQNLSTFFAEVYDTILLFDFTYLQLLKCDVTVVIILVLDNSSLHSTLVMLNKLGNNGFWLVFNIKRLYLWGLRESMIKELSETMYINEREDS